MARSRKEDAKSKGDRLQAILRLVQEYPISRQEVLLDHLRREGFEVTQVHRTSLLIAILYGISIESFHYE